MAAPSRLNKEVRDVLLALVLTAVGLGYSVSGLPANIIVGCVIWGCAWLFLTHLFWIIEWTSRCPTEVKGVFWAGVTFLVILALWNPVQVEYAKEQAPPTVSKPESAAPAPPASVPVPIVPRSYIVFDGPPAFEPRRDNKGAALPDQNPQVGDPFVFNFDFKQQGPNPVELIHVSKRLYLKPDSDPQTQNTVIADFAKQVRAEASINHSATFAIGKSAFNSAFAIDDNGQGRIVTKDDLDALHAGTEVAIVIVQINYRDDRKVHHARLCYFLQPPAYFPGVWQACQGFNHSD
jgi:hypothetical protein